MTTYVNPFTGQTISPSQVSYEDLSISVDTALEWPINGNQGDVASAIIDVTATVASLKLALPPATQVSTGQSVLVRNVGANTFTVTDTSGNTIISVASGIAEFIFLTSNTTINGTWATVTFGAGTSTANASAPHSEASEAKRSSANSTERIISAIPYASRPVQSGEKVVRTN